MATTRLLLAGGLLTGILVASSACSKPDAPAADAKTPWADYVAGVIDEYYRRNPEVAVNAGLHQYDGQASDRSLEAAGEYVDWLDAVIDEASSYADLVGIEAFERDYLVQAMRGQRFYPAETDYLTKNPLYYTSRLNFSVYVEREYAPLAQRVAAYTDYMSQVPRILGQMRDNLEPPLPRPYVTVAHGVLTGLHDYLLNTVPGLFSAVDDEQLKRRFDAANSAAADAVQQTADWLDGLKATATDDYALGRDGFLSMLRETQGVDVTLDSLQASGAADLQRNLDALHDACAEFAPGASTQDCVLQVQGRKPPEGAVAGASRQLPGLKAFLVEQALVTIPGTEDALVAEAPPHRRFNAAYISIPGPFEEGLPSIYYIAPPDPAWSEEDQLAYVPGETDLLAISVHEVWPGHFLQYLHANRTANRVGRHFGTYTFSEGWAHYTEEMMVDAGLGDGDPEVRIGQLLNALLRNVRYMSAIGLHAEGMTVEESQQLFEEKGFQDYGNAMQQANRGTYDPGYLNYTLGKLMIVKLRDDWTRGRGGREAWGEFHDRFLSYGTPPIPLVRRQMLGDDYDGDRSLLPDP